MFICNFKLDKQKIKKYGIISSIVITSLVVVFICYKAVSNTYVFRVNDEMEAKDVTEISAQNYTNILKSVHDDVDTYIGQKIRFTGYVYRVFDFNSNQFVLARNMVISSDFQTVVVGFLCESNETCNYEDGTWVEIDGEITKGNYHGEIPVIKVLKIKSSDKPNEEFVYPPDDTFIPTAAIY